MSHSSSRARVAGFRLVGAALTILPFLMLGGCDQGGSDGTKRMSFISSKEFHRGYEEGMAHGEKAIFNDSGGWMWLWMKPEEYRRGYERGWGDGRKVRGLKKNEADVRPLATPPPPPPEKAPPPPAAQQG